MTLSVASEAVGIKLTNADEYLRIARIWLSENQGVLTELGSLAEISETIITQSLELHVKHKVIIKW